MGYVRLPDEILRLIFNYASDWELATTLHIDHDIPIRSPWDEQATRLDVAMLRCWNERHLPILEQARAECPTFSQWGLRAVVKYGYVHVLQWLLEHDSAQLHEVSFELLPVVASAWGRTEVLEWASASGYTMCTDPDVIAEAIGDASRNGEIAALNFWLESRLPLHYTEEALSSATMKRQLRSLEWWKSSGLPLKVGNVLDFASLEGSAVCLDWWAASGLPARYSKAALYCLSRAGNVKLLNWWKAHAGQYPLVYDKECLLVATKFGHATVLQWWLDSGLDVEYRFFDIEEALEDCVLGERKEEVQAWWARLGYDPRLPPTEWTKYRNFRFQHNILTAPKGDRRPDDHDPNDRDNHSTYRSAHSGAASRYYSYTSRNTSSSSFTPSSSSSYHSKSTPNSDTPAAPLGSLTSVKIC